MTTSCATCRHWQGKPTDRIAMCARYPQWQQTMSAHRCGEHASIPEPTPEPTPEPMEAAPSKTKPKPRPPRASRHRRA